MKEKLGCGLLILIVMGLWIGLIKGCHMYEDWRRAEYFRKADEKNKNWDPSKAPRRKYVSSERRKCSRCKEYAEVTWCELCCKYFCSDCYSADIAITHDGKIPTDDYGNDRSSYPFGY